MMDPTRASYSRRRFLARFGTGAAALVATRFFEPAAFADALLIPTPGLTEGPFYPDQLPLLDQDNDLLIVGKNLTPAVGEVTHLTGRVTDAKGEPLAGATVEIWQCDANQVYLNTRDSLPKARQRDANFQGFGTCATTSDGGYRFRTIKPVPYPGRPGPHVHFRVKKDGRELLTTQMLIRGHPGNARDGVFGGVRDPIDRELVLVDFVPIKESKVGELSAKFDIVLGRTPADGPARRPRG